MALQVANFGEESTFNEINLITAGMVTRVSIFIIYLFIYFKKNPNPWSHTSDPVSSGVADYAIFLTTLYDIIYAFSRTT